MVPGVFPSKEPYKAGFKAEAISKDLLKFRFVPYTRIEFTVNFESAKNRSPKIFEKPL
jgi:hypothetical protein